jgi:hypothetical protein
MCAIKRNQSKDARRYRRNAREQSTRKNGIIWGRLPIDDSPWYRVLSITCVLSLLIVQANRQATPGLDYLVSISSTRTLGEE